MSPRTCVYVTTVLALAQADAGILAILGSGSAAGASISLISHVGGRSDRECTCTGEERVSTDGLLTRKIQ